MALHAGLTDRGVGKLLVLEGLGLVGMAFETDGIGGCAQQFGEIALMYGMTGRAATNGGRTMCKLAFHYGAVMTRETELGAGGTKLVFVGGLVRVMAGKTLAFLYRRMHVFVRIEPFVTFSAQLSGVFNLFEVVLPCRLVTEDTIARCHGTMNIFLCFHAVMAIRCFAGFLWGRGLTAYCTCISGKG